MAKHDAWHPSGNCIPLTAIDEARRAFGIGVVPAVVMWNDAANVANFAIAKALEVAREQR